jgi:hypothetical protein
MFLALEHGVMYVLSFATMITWLQAQAAAVVLASPPADGHAAAAVISCWGTPTRSSRPSSCASGITPRGRIDHGKRCRSIFLWQGLPSRGGGRRPLAQPVSPLPSAAAFPAPGALLCWSLENCTGSERDRPRRRALICRFDATPVNPSNQWQRRTNIWREVTSPAPGAGD